MTGESRWVRSPSVLAAAGALVAVVVFELVIARAGAPSNFTLFLGRFHPLVVHLPIGVLVLVGLAEAATLVPRYRVRIDPALGLALPVLLLVTVTAFVFGHFLGRSGGFAANALMLHRRLEFLAVIGVCVSVALFTRQAETATPAARNAYRAALSLTLGLLSVGAHFGGTVTHGDSYLTEYAPGPLKRLLGESERTASPSGSAKAQKPKVSAEPLVFGDVVLPIFEKYCVECHGPKKSKGKLRLDSIDAMLKGGEGGPALVAGSAATSELVERVRLPVDDDDRMPPEGKPGPTVEELAVVAFWIDRGASPALRVRDTLAPAGGRKVLEAALAEAPRAPGAAPTTEAPTTETEKKQPEAAATSEPTTTAPESKPDHVRRERSGDGADAKAPDEPTTATQGAAPPAPKPTAAPAGGRAVLAEKCEKCHGSSKKKGGLRVDSLDALLAGGENGPALVPGDPGRSEIIRRIRLPTTQKEHMPPKKEPQLTEAEVAALTAWVRGLSRGAAEAERKAPAESAVKAEAPSASRSEDPSGASAENASPGAAATDAANEPATKAPESPVAEAPNDEPAAPPDEALLARVPPRIVLYEEAVAPLLSTRCGKCHSGQKPAARLRIDDFTALVEGGLSGPGIVPGKPDESFVYQRISLPPDHDDRMPPEGEPAITPDEVALVRFWVERGASRTLALPSEDVPAPALRAAAAYTRPSGKDGALKADAGCAACAVGGGSGSSEKTFGLVAVALVAFVFRRSSRSREARSTP